ncbi:MAG: hypothetical protein MPL62_04535 [Alphaproteobacteria bacterium]|nr:hypothetical protein [Alphaproteobacteria bacterium]
MFAASGGRGGLVMEPAESRRFSVWCPGASCPFKFPGLSRLVGCDLRQKTIRDLVPGWFPARFSRIF